MQVSAAVMKCREQETAFRKFHDPVTDTVTDAVFRFVVAQSGFGEPDRADAAQDVFVNLIGRIEHLCIIFGLSRNIVGSMYENDKIIFRIVIMFDDLVITFIDKSIIRQTAVF